MPRPTFGSHDIEQKCLQAKLSGPQRCCFHQHNPPVALQNAFVTTENYNSQSVVRQPLSSIGDLPRGDVQLRLVARNRSFIGTIALTKALQLTPRFCW